MIKKVAIVTDSTGCLTDDLLKEYNIHTNYLNIIFGTSSYQEFKEISSAKFIELMNAQEELPTTSQPAPGVTMDLYESLLANGYDEIIHITISSGLSGTYQAALTAASNVKEGSIHVFDSKTVIFPQGAMAIAAAKLANSGHSVHEILTRLEEIKHENFILGAVKNLDNLKKGGRLSNLQAYFGNLLNVKPIISMTEVGKLEAIEKVRTFKKALAHLIDETINANLDESYELSIMHLENTSDAMTVLNALQSAYPNHNIHLLPLSLVIGVHTGDGTVGVAWSKTN